MEEADGLKNSRPYPQALLIHAFDLGHFFPRDKQLERGHCAHATVARRLLISVHVDFRKRDGGKLCGHCFEGGGYLLAWPAPLRSKINDNNALVGKERGRGVRVSRVHRDDGDGEGDGDGPQLG